VSSVLRTWYSFQLLENWERNERRDANNAGIGKQCDDFPHPPDVLARAGAKPLASVGGAQPREPDDTTGLAKAMPALFRRDLARGPENVFARWFAHARRMPPLNRLLSKPSSRNNRWRFKSGLSFSPHLLFFRPWRNLISSINKTKRKD
jgi:hypothetical protein